jgi:hypothetical protein
MVISPDPGGGGVEFVLGRVRASSHDDNESGCPGAADRGVDAGALDGQAVKQPGEVSAQEQIGPGLAEPKIRG